MDSTIVSAIIAALVTTLGVIVTYFSTKQQLKLKLKEINLKQEELNLERKKLESIGNDLQKEMATLHQNQLQDVLKKRIEVYPHLWEVVTVHWQHFDNNKKDINWCKTFINELERCNEQYGVYFSQAVYEQYHTFYMELKKIMLNLETFGGIIDNNDISTIDLLWYGNEKYGLGLASQLKNDLGSYKIALIQDKSNHLKLHPSYNNKT